MEGGKVVLFDASPYMLIEASGDSEAGFFDAAESDDAASEDDAQSCSCGWAPGAVALEEIGAGEDVLYAADFDDCVEEVEEDGDDALALEDGVVDQCCGGRNAAVAEEVKNSRACEDSNLKLMNEGETDRLFWEACLAS